MEKRSPYTYIAGHPSVNNERDQDTVAYESFEIPDQDETSNIGRNISMVMSELDVF